ncbi:MAG: ABC transporter permease subunit [bacterium]|nr:ABC transporter permease subunit [bacterium]
MRRAVTLLFALFLLAGLLTAASAQTIHVGSKNFTESVILGDIASQLIRDAGFQVDHRKGFGTRFLWNGLEQGDIDLYPEYTGTLTHEILSQQKIQTDDELRAALRERGLRMTKPLGFNNTYALAMRERRASELGVKTISDLRAHPDLAFGFSNEFMDRADGWPALKQRYNLPQTNVNGLEHDLAYRGLEGGSIDLADVYATDAEIEYYHLHVLEDDLGHFPEYKAVFLYREELRQSAPAVVERLDRLAGAISDDAMRSMNAQAKIEQIPDGQVASEFIRREFNLDTQTAQRTLWERFVYNTMRHLYLVGVSMAGAILIAIPLGVAAAKSRGFGQAILGVVSVIQTIPSLAIFVFMIPLLGIGAKPAIAALFFYSLLPIVRNTYAGLCGIPVSIRESAEAMGLPAFARLRLIELPLAFRSILAGVKTSVVINIGTATLGALIGAGGYGQPILTGIRLDNMGLIMEGAVPAAIMALAAQGLFELIERWLIPHALRS